MSYHLIITSLQVHKKHVQTNKFTDNIFLLKNVLTSQINKLTRCINQIKLILNSDYSTLNLLKIPSKLLTCICHRLYSEFFFFFFYQNNAFQKYINNQTGLQVGVSYKVRKPQWISCISFSADFSKIYYFIFNFR